MRLTIEKLFIWGVGAIVLLFVLPSLLFVNLENAFHYFIDDQDLFRTTFLRSTIFALLTSLFCVGIGMSGGLLLSKISLGSRLGKLLSFLFLPFVMGSISTAFLFKILLFDSPVIEWAFVDSSRLFSILSVIQIWQFGTLFIYLFWLRNLGIAENRRAYASAINLSPWEKFKYIVLPESKNLIILLFLLAFVFSLYEDSKTQLIFKASQGTDSELISHWLFRNFQKDILVNFDYAAGNSFSVSWLVILSFSFLVFTVSAIGLNRGALWVSRRKGSRNSQRHQKPSTGSTYFHYALVSLILIIILLPIMLTFFEQPISFSNNISQLAEPLALTTLAGLLSAGVAMLFSIFSRLAWPSMMAQFNQKSILFLSFLFLVLLLPPIVIMLSGFKWMSIIGYTSKFGVTFFWTMGHIILSLPILGSFLVITHFSVKNSELDYLKTYGFKRTEVLKYSFVRRFLLEYFLTGIFAVSMIWNEGILNRVFSDHIPSFVSSMQNVLVSRDADYSVGMMYFLVSLAIGLLVVLVWTLIVSKAEKRLT